MAQFETSVPWNPSGSDMEHHAGGFNMHARPISQPVGAPRSSATIVQVLPDVKPRLTKDQHEILERHFAHQPKPSTNTKRTYANALGVPLDKINNWFQNRRAKVKQDAKKQLNAFNLFQATIAQHSQQYFQQPQHSASAGPPQFMGPPPVVPSNTSPSIEPLARPSTAPQTTNVGSDPSMAHSMPQYHDDAFIHQHHEMALQNPLTTAVQATAFPAQHFPHGMNHPPEYLGHGFDFGQDFSTVDFEGYVQQPVMEEVPMTTMAEGSWLTPSASASPNTMPSLVKGEDGQDVYIESPPQLTEPSGHPTPTDSTYTTSTAAPGADLFEQQNVSAPAVYINHGSPEGEERKDSLGLISPLDNVVFESSSENESSISVPKLGGIAARRQKRGPTALAFPPRSASYSVGMPGSPGANAAAAQDQLRRIRSHGPGLVNAGKITKDSRPQKSPLHATFTDAALASPKFRHVANYSVSSVSSGPLTATTMPGSLAPPTPITPHEMGFPAFQGHGGKVMHPNGSPGAFSAAGEDAIYMPASSPCQDPRMDQVRNLWAAQQVSLFNTPPQSAPPTQQHFGFSPSNVHAAHAATLRNGAGHIRRPSLPEDVQAQWVQPGMEMPMQYHPQLAQGFCPEPIPVTAQMAMSAACGPGVFYPDMTMPFIHPEQAQHEQLNAPIHFSNQTPEDYKNGGRPR